MSWNKVTTFHSFANRNFRWYWIGILFSFSASQMQQLARGWLVYDMTHSSLALGIVISLWGVPIIVFSLIGGAVADKVPKRNLILATETGATLIYFILALLIWLNLIAIWHLMIASFFSGIIMAFNTPARQSYMPELVSDKELLNAVSLNSIAANLTRVAGPAVAGAIIATVGVAEVYFITAAMNALAVATIAIVPVRGNPHNIGHKSLTVDVKEGLNYIKNSPIVTELIIQFAIVTLFAMPYMYMLPVFASEVLSVGARGLGWMTSLVGIGALVGILTIASLGNVRRKGAIVISLAISFGLFLFLFSLSRNYFLSLALLAGVGIGNMCYNSLNNMLLLTQTPPEMRGRVMSFMIMTFGLTPLGVLPIGALAEVIGAPWAVGGGGLIVVLATIALTAWRPALRKL
ncbi:MAG: MFS transporter [Dehalococcoidia bacterium]|nr:MFS transporter [Dehalococcoidia bacterium]